MLWYHDHSMHVTRLNVFAGLAGAWLVRDAEERSLHLPSGRHELPLVIQDRNLDLDGNGQFTGAMLHKTEVIPARRSSALHAGERQDLAQGIGGAATLTACAC